MTRSTIYTREPEVQELYRWLTPNPNLPDGLPRDIAREVFDLAGYLLTFLADDPELTAGLRKLLEAKDCFVRAAL